MQASATDNRPRPTPLALLSSGRSGSTFLMRLLAGHPEIVAHTLYPCELMLMTFAAFPADKTYGNTNRLFRYAFDGDVEVLKGPLAAKVAFGATEVRGVYDRMAKNLGKQPRYYLEKTTNSHDLTPMVASFPDIRFVLLLRDPRDTFLSAKAFNARRGFTAFWEKPGDSDEQSIVRQRARLEGIVSAAEKAPYHVIRYEDLIEAPQQTLPPLIEWLGLPSSSAIASSMIASAAAFNERYHKTSASSAASIGRWQREMSLQRRALFQSHMGDLLKRLGYDGA